MNVKICGITTLHAAKAVEKAGADFIGFVFTPSKRRISPANAALIAKELAPSVKKVGIFVNEPIANMRYIANMVGLDYIQLHGDEPASIAHQLSYPIIKAFSIAHVTSSLIATYPCDYLLIDSPGEKYRGGSGKTFTWDRLEKLNIPREKLILAGGLSAHNVTQAIEQVHPSGVDVSSGVETSGVKDLGKISLFTNKAKTTRKVDIT